MTVKIVVPIKYTTRQGGELLDWPSDCRLHEETLDKIEKKNHFNTEICGLQVHSLIFEHGLRWDCYNGWNLPNDPFRKY